MLWLMLCLWPQSAQLATEYCVKPSSPATAVNHDVYVRGTPCQFLNDYLANQTHYFTNNTVFRFLPGTHEMNRSLIVHNVDGLQLVRVNDSIDRSEINVTATNHTQWITFINATNLRIEGLTFEICGNSSPLQSGLNFIIGINLTLHNILLGQRPPCDGNQSITTIIQHHIDTTVSNISGSPHNSAVRVQFNNVFNVNITHIEPWYMCNNTRSEKVSCSCFSLQLVFVVWKGRVEKILRRREYFTLIDQSHFCRRDPVSFTLGKFIIRMKMLPWLSILAIPCSRCLHHNLVSI